MVAWIAPGPGLCPAGLLLIFRAVFGFLPDTVAKLSFVRREL
jgi:hypothetical protein